MKRNVILVFAVCLGLASCGEGPAQSEASTSDEPGADEGKLWVTGERLTRHTCPSDGCGVVGQLFFREGVESLEERDGWVRITEEYDASCQGGESEYVDEGNVACTSANGITGGRFAEWVRLDGLSETRPDDPAETATANEQLVSQSDDFARYKDAFTSLAAQLISEGRCTEADFREMGGFVKSVTAPYDDEPVYFTYCGGMTTANKVYVNAQTGEVVR